MKSDFVFNNMKRTIALMVAALMVLVFALATGCSLKDKDDKDAEPTQSADNGDNEGGTVKTPGNPVVISTPNKDFTLYDFRQAYYSNQYYMYLMYGMIGPAEYFDMVVDDATTFLYVYNAAVDAGVELNEDENAEFEERFNSQIENVISQYMNDVDESVVGDAERRAAAIELLNADLAEDDLDYDTFISLARNNMLMYSIADKYYQQIQDAVEVSEEEVLSYVNDQLGSADEMTISTFKDQYEAYSGGQGYFPVYVPDDCFSVNHILLQYETESDENGGVVYLTESRKADEQELESKLASTADFNAFMELEVEYGEDPGMDEEGFRENGYLIHGDFDYSYFTGFVYAAMNLYYGSWTPSPNPDTGESYDLPQLDFFTLQDGTKVVKVRTEPGVHYIIVNKTFNEGPVEYEIGDSHWMSWTEGAQAQKFSDQYDDLRSEWEEKYPVTVYSDVFRAEFVPAGSETDTENDGDPQK